MTTLRVLLKFFATTLLLPVAGFSACTAETREYGSGGSSGSSSSSSSTGMPCTEDAQCGASSECQTFTCVKEVCSVSFASMGTPVALQQAGDCSSKICNGQGLIVDTADATDPADDGNPCTLDACVGAQTQHGFLMAGTMCSDARYCDGAGYCVECLDSSQCGSAVCTMNVCAAPECSDMIKNGMESDTDCGGPLCPVCGPGLTCGTNADCKSQVCDAGICAVPTCSDGTQNGLETYIDCGGPDCLPCKAGVPCNAGIDCQSGICLNNTCQEASCDDQVKNGTESDIDCGGPSCPQCTLGRMCNDASDCVSLDCCISDPAMPGYCKSPAGQCVAAIRSEMNQ